MNFQAISGINALGIPPLQTPNTQPGSFIQNIDLLRNAGQALGVQQTDEVGFESIFQAYMNMLQSAERAEAQSQHLSLEFALGNHDDMLAVIMAQEMAFTSMQFAVQVTSRFIEAYREIMRMQI